jgi:crossover junction endodeoxyribonuclease RusA
MNALEAARRAYNMSILDLETKRPSITFRVASVPVPKGSMRAFVRGGRPILTSDNRSLKGWEAIVRAQAQAHVQALWPASVAVTLAFALPRTKSLPKRTERAHLTKPDLDKLARAVLDALTGVAFNDDAQVTQLACKKRYALEGEQPGVLVTLTQAQMEATCD